ncbi:MAG: glycosyltransferase [Rikenellaceae bacterium]
MDKSIDISVIVPIYKVEKFIERSLTTLFEQSKSDGVEFLLINDATPDRSMEIARQVAARYPGLDIKLIDMPKNGGTSAVRQRGIELAQGKYSIQYNSDDYCEREMLADLYAAAEAEGADIVICDLYINGQGWQKISDQSAAVGDGVGCADLMLRQRLISSLWNKLVRHSLYRDNGIDFKSGVDMAEDLLACIRLLTSAEKVAYVNRAYYHYVRYNTGSMTRNMGSKALDDSQKIQTILESFLRANDTFERLKESLYLYRLSTKWALLCSSADEDFARYLAIYPETRGYIGAYQKSKKRLHRTRTLWCASRGYGSLARALVYHKRRKIAR